MLNKICPIDFDISSLTVALIENRNARRKTSQDP